MSVFKGSRPPPPQLLTLEHSAVFVVAVELCGLCGDQRKIFSDMFSDTTVYDYLCGRYNVFALLKETDAFHQL